MSEDGKKRITVVRLPPQEHAVYFVVPRDYDQFVVDEHTCPVNLFVEGCRAIIIEGDSDPHGLFEHVRTIDEPNFLTSKKTEFPDMEWPKIIPEAYPTVIEHEAGRKGSGSIVVCCRVVLADGTVIDNHTGAMELFNDFPDMSDLAKAMEPMIQAIRDAKK